MSLISSFNWVDWLVLAGVLYFVFEGWRAGFVQLFSGFVAYAGAIWLSVRYHAYAGSLLYHQFGIPSVWANLIGYVLIAFAVQIVVSRLLIEVVKRAGKKLVGTRVDDILGSVVAVADYLILLAFAFLVILVLPVTTRFKDDVRSSILARQMVQLVEKYGGSVTSSLAEVTRNAVGFLTVKPQSEELIKLDIHPQEWELTVDSNSEKQMAGMVNDERIKVGTVPLSSDPQLTQVAEAHSRDMLMRGYFSHVDPEGHDLKYRLSQAHIGYEAAGENLAYAPNVIVAMKGLMNSEGHRKNILDPSYERIGVGVIDAGVYGKMFTQVFTGQQYYFYHSP